MFAILGEIPFEVFGSPERLDAVRLYDYAEHRVVEDRPRLQWLAESLEVLELEMMFHRSFTDPMAKLALLIGTAEMHLPLPLVFGNGEFWGFFVITEIGTASRQLSGVGDPLAVTVRVVLREWPLAFDPEALPVPTFTPIGIAAAAAMTAAAAAPSLAGAPAPFAPLSLPSAGVSPLLRLAPPSGPGSAGLQPGDVPPAQIVRSR